ncbi:hypothetical protein [Paracoccus fontiphilus]|uniref:DUF4268 domain-containing protein n=1 Tax=Paracoccus fontiphilus TaxID=1815556 RepID=A0ABV7IM98_9RHOB
MSRRTTNPIHIPADNDGISVLTVQVPVSESFIQDLVHRHPEALPITEIDPAFLGAVPICRELNTPAGPIDNFLVTPSGLPVIVECKLWRNPQARREVVGQILDYAKELSRWTSADIEREASKRGSGTLVELIRSAGHEVDEAAFHDNLSASLERGRCLLLILGDGIRHGVEAIFEHLQTQGALQFSFGLVEFPIYELTDGGRIAIPSILARSKAEIRHVVELPSGMAFAGNADGLQVAEADEAVRQQSERYQRFWEMFYAHLDLDDPDQPVGRAMKLAYTTFLLPVPDRSCWLTVYREGKGEVGLVLSCSKNGDGAQVIAELIAAQGEALRDELGGTARLNERKSMKGTLTIGDRLDVGDLSDSAGADKAARWLATRTNDFINVLRPAIRSIVADMQETNI